MAGITADQKRAARNMLTIAKRNADTIKGEHARALATYDTSDAQSAAAAKLQKQQHSGVAAGDRFAQAKKLQSSTKGILSGAGSALMGSQAEGIQQMVKSRTDADSGEVYGTLRQNHAAVQNSLDEALAASNIARKDVTSAAVKDLRAQESEASAQLNNINSKLFKKPGKGKTNFGSKQMADRFAKIKATKPTATGYFMSDNDIRSGY